MSNPLKRQILVVDDNPAVRETISMLLVAAGYNVVVAEDGFAALSQLKKTLPDVIVSDLGDAAYDGIRTALRRSTSLPADLDPGYKRWVSR